MTLKPKEKKLLIALGIVAVIAAVMLYRIYGPKKHELKVISESKKEEKKDTRFHLLAATRAFLPVINTLRYPSFVSELTSFPITLTFENSSGNSSEIVQLACVCSTSSVRTPDLST